MHGLPDQPIFFSVIIPCYNRADFIGPTLESVLEQTFFQFEVIVVNDGSTDHTNTVIQPYLRDERVKLFSIANGERGAARNFGVNVARGRYVTFLDSDDLLLPWHLAEAFSIVNTQSVDVFHLNYEVLYPNGRVLSLPKLPMKVNSLLLEGNFLSCMGVFLRVEVAKANRFNEMRVLAGSEDYELWLRLAARMPIYCFPKVTSRLVNHPTRSVVSGDMDGLVSRISMLEKCLREDLEFQNFVGDEKAKFYAYVHLYLALHLALLGERWVALVKIPEIVFSYPRILFNYRFIVLVKKIMWK